MRKIEFLVQGSSDEPYIVRFIKLENVLSATCTCPAGENGMYCKHRINILKGDNSNIVSSNIEDVNEVLNWIPGSPLETAMLNVLNAEAEFEAAKRNLSTIKKKLAFVMLGRN